MHTILLSIPYRTVRYRTVRYRTSLVITIPYRTLPFRTVRYCTVPGTVRYGTMFIILTFSQFPSRLRKLSLQYRTVPYHLYTVHPFPFAMSLLITSALNAIGRVSAQTGTSSSSSSASAVSATSKSFGRLPYLCSSSSGAASHPHRSSKVISSVAGLVTGRNFNGSSSKSSLSHRGLISACAFRSVCSASVAMENPLLKVRRAVLCETTRDLRLSR